MKSKKGVKATPNLPMSSRMQMPSGTGSATKVSKKAVVKTPSKKKMK